MEVTEQGQTLDELAKSGWKEAPPPAAPAPSKGHDFKILGVNIHVPGEDKPRADSNIIGTASGAGIAPEDALMAGSAVRAVAQAGPTIAAKAGAAVSQAAPIVKYEATKSALEHLGIPSPLAMAAAMMVSGYKKGAKPIEGPASEGPHLDRSVPVRPSDLTPEQLADRIKFGSGTPAQVRGFEKPPIVPSAAPASPVASGPVAPAPQAAVAAPPVASAPRPVAPSPRGASAPSPVAPSPVPQAPPPDVMQRLSPATEAAVSPPPPATMGPDGQLVGRPGGNPAMPDQKALNEAALAVRRAAYQARMSSAPPVEAPVAAAPAANVKLSAPETKAFLDLMKRGFSGPDAMKSVLQQRQLVEMLGSPTPTAAETRFPKGQRGKLMSQP